MQTSNRRIDHLVLPVRDLEAAADFYRRLGFQVGRRNRHPWGTENRLIQFRSSFLELITVGEHMAAIPPHEPGHFSFGAFIRDYLEQGEGCAMFVLDSSDAKADAVTFSRLGIGPFEPFYFERKAKRPDGSETRVAFTLAFTTDPKLPGAGFFVCQQHQPENFWNADFQIHPNGASDLTTVILSVPDPAEHMEFLSGFTGVPGTGEDRGGIEFPLRHGGRLQVARGKGTVGFSAFSVAVKDLSAVSQQLTQTGIQFERAASHVTVAAQHAFGVSVGFVSRT